MTTTPQRIDVHYHIIPEPYVEALAALRRVADPEHIRFGTNFPWDDAEVAEASLRGLDAA